MKCIDAVLFDFDGVLIDSLACMESAWSKTKQKYSLFPEFSDYAKHIGKPFPTILSELRVEKSLHADVTREYSALSSSSIHLIKEMPKLVNPMGTHCWSISGCLFIYAIFRYVGFCLIFTEI